MGCGVSSLEIGAGGRDDTRSTGAPAADAGRPPVLSGTAVDAGSLGGGSSPGPADAGSAARFPDGGLVGVFPAYLPNGRTYDQERGFIAWSGAVSFVTLTHRDGTALPASEGGTACGGDCDEQVTRLEAGSSVSGNFAELETFNVQLAAEPGAGSAVVEACGQVIAQPSLGTSGGTAGFNNYPAPAWTVPTAAPCTWKISAVGSFVSFRAVTARFRTAAQLPTVDVRINGSDGPLSVTSPADFTVSWTSSNGVCAASGDWLGSPLPTGSVGYSGMPRGTYSFTLTCTNALGSASDTATISLVGID
jgi:hypothetical protein